MSSSEIQPADPPVAEEPVSKETDLDEVIKNETESKHENVVEKLKDAAEDLVVKGLHEVKEKLGDIGIKSSTMHLVIKHVMETVENFPTTGSARRSLALRIIKDLVGELPESSEKNFILETLNNGLVADTIDLIIAATRGNLAVNIVEDVALSCIPGCIKYIREKLAKRKKRKAEKKAAILRDLAQPEQAAEQQAE